MKEPKNQKKKPRKKKLIILFSVLAVIISAGVAVAISQRNNIAAARYFLTYTPEEISEKIAQNEQRILDAIEEHLPVTVQDLTDEEKELMAVDVLSKEDAIGLLVERAKADNSFIGESQLVQARVQVGSRQAQESPQENDSLIDRTQSAAVSDRERLEAFDSTMDIMELATTEENASYYGVASNIIELIAEVYVLRAYFTNRLEQMRRSAIDEYLALSEDRRSEAVRMEIGMRYVGLAGALEAECDGLMNDIITRLRIELERTGGDTSLVNDIMFSYAEEKSLKKAYYMSLYS
jgi:hypothetical protein